MLSEWFWVVKAPPAVRCPVRDEGGWQCSRDSDQLVQGIPLCWQHRGVIEQRIEGHVSGLAIAAVHADREVYDARDRKLAASSVVYYLRRQDELIKIGYSARLRTRMAVLAKEHGPLTLLASHRGWRDAERSLHRKFADDRVEGEWFLPSDELLAHIAHVNQRQAA